MAHKSDLIKHKPPLPEANHCKRHVHQRTNPPSQQLEEKPLKDKACLFQSCIASQTKTSRHDLLSTGPQRRHAHNQYVLKTKASTIKPSKPIS